MIQNSNNNERIDPDRSEERVVLSFSARGSGWSSWYLLDRCSQPSPGTPDSFQFMVVWDALCISSS